MKFGSGEVWSRCVEFSSGAVGLSAVAFGVVVVGSCLALLSSGTEQPGPVLSSSG